MNDLNHRTRKFSRLLHSHKIHLLEELFSQTQMTDFPNLLYTSTSEIPAYPFIYLNPEKGTPFVKAGPPPIADHYREYPHWVYEMKPVFTPQ